MHQCYGSSIIFADPDPSWIREWTRIECRNILVLQSVRSETTVFLDKCLFCNCELTVPVPIVFQKP